MSQESAPLSKPVPVPDDLSRPFFEAARRHQLVTQRCRQCQTYQTGARIVCDECLSPELEWTPVSGRGSVHTFAIMHQRYHPAFFDELPYNIAVVELEEGPRLPTNLVGVANEDIRVGMPVVVMFEDVSEEISLPKFRPA